MDIKKINPSEIGVSDGASVSTVPSQTDSVQTNSEEGSVLVPKLAIDGQREKPAQMKPVKTDEKSGKNRKYLKHWKKAAAVFLVIFLLLALVVGFVGYQSYSVYKDTLVVKDSARKLIAISKSQNLPQIKGELVAFRSSVNDLDESYSNILWMKSIPYVGSYVSDGERGLNAAVYGLDAADIVISAVEPYADIIGLNDGSVSEEPVDGVQTAQDRIDFIVSTIPELVPMADELSTKVALIQEELSNIDPERYPEEYQGIKVREKMKDGLDMLNIGATFITNGKPLLEVAPAILGTDEERTYLVIFQNDKELRPTGGFLTAYSIAKVNRGKFELVSSNDIYNLDSNYTPSVRAADPIIKLIQGPYVVSRNLRLRDANWDPDFGDSMEFFVGEARKAGIGDVDGIIGVDTQLLVNILEVIGPIGVPGYGNFSAEIDDRCNCPNVVYELESFADVEGAIVWDQLDPTKIIFAPANYENRKKIIGPLMNSVLSNSLGQSSEKIPNLFEAVFKSITEKHVVVYMLDESEQKAVADFGIAGKIKDYDGDYLHINDANLGGRKSNLYVTHAVNQDIEIDKGGTVTKTVTITYTNPEKYDGWLNSILPNWLRVYVPEGSELIDFEGVEDVEDPYVEHGKTVFAGLVEVRPQGVSKVIVKYKLPMKMDGEIYNMLIQKQPVKDGPLHTINIGKTTEELFLKTDREFKFRI